LTAWSTVNKEKSFLILKSFSQKRNGKKEEEGSAEEKGG
jgi:hypothetical protein